MLEGILVEEHGATMLGDNVEVLLQGAVGDEARPLLNANHVPRAVTVICQSTLVRSPRGTGFHDKMCNLSVRRRLGWSGFKAGPGERRGKRSRNSAMGSHSLKKVRSEGGTSA